MILDIYHDFLLDFKNCVGASNSSPINFGDFIDVLKIDVDKYWNIIFSTNKNLRLIAFKVLKQCYYQGLMSYVQASELFLVWLNDNLTEADPHSGDKISDEAIGVLREICKKDAKVLFKLDLACVSYSCKVT